MEIITYVNLFSFIFYFFVTILRKKKRCSLCCTNGSRKPLYSKKSSLHIITDLLVTAQKVTVGDASITQKIFRNEQIVEITTDAHRPIVIVKYGPTSSFDAITSVISEKTEIKYHSMSAFIVDFVVHYLQKMQDPQQTKMVKQKIAINRSPRKRSQRRRKKKIITISQNALEVNSDINKIVTPINSQDKSTFVDEKEFFTVMGSNERQHAISYQCMNSLPKRVKEEPNCDDDLSLNHQVLPSYDVSQLDHDLMKPLDNMYDNIKPLSQDGSITISTNYNTEDVNSSDSFVCKKLESCLLKFPDHSPAISNKINVSKFNNDIKEPVELTNSVSFSSVNVSKDSCKNGEKISCEIDIKEEHERNLTTKSFFCKDSKESLQNFTSKEQHEIDHIEGTDISSDERKPFQLLNEEKYIGNITENENSKCRICGQHFDLLSSKYQHEESHNRYRIGHGNKILSSSSDKKVDETIHLKSIKKKAKRKGRKRMHGYVNHQFVKHESVKHQSAEQDYNTNVPKKFRTFNISRRRNRKKKQEEK